MTIKKEKLTKELKKELYVDPSEFWNEIDIFYGQKSAQFPLKLGFMIDKIANKFSYSGNYINYTFRDEMVADAKEKMLSVLLEKKFKLYTYTILDKKNYIQNGDDFLIREYSRGIKADRGKIIFDNATECRQLTKDEKVVEVDGQLNLRTKNMAFGYFTQICKHCFWSRIKKEEQIRDTIENLREKTWNDMYNSGHEGWDLIRKPKFGLDDGEEGFNFEDM